MDTATLKLSDKHPLNGMIVEMVRRDPFNRFVVVRLTKAVAPYKKGDELHFSPTLVKPK